jgi:hypothetical protein
MLRLDPVLVADVLAAGALRTASLPATDEDPTGALDAAVLLAVLRTVQLLDTPEDIPILAPLAMRELVYRLATADQGHRLRWPATDNAGPRCTHRPRGVLAQGELRRTSAGSCAGGPRELEHILPARTFPRGHRDDTAAVPEGSAAWRGTSAHGRRLLRRRHSRQYSWLHQSHTVLTGIPAPLRLVALSRRTGPPQCPRPNDHRGPVVRRPITQHATQSHPPQTACVLRGVLFAAIAQLAFVSCLIDNLDRRWATGALPHPTLAGLASPADQLPGVHRGRRFSAKARRPSATSSPAKRVASNSSLAAHVVASSVTDAASLASFRVAATARGAASRI